MSKDLKKPKCQEPEGIHKKDCVCCILWDERYDEKVKELEGEMKLILQEQIDFNEEVHKEIKKERKVLEDANKELNGFIKSQGFKKITEMLAENKVMIDLLENAKEAMLQAHKTYDPIRKWLSKFKVLKE